MMDRYKTSFSFLQSISLAWLIVAVISSCAGSVVTKNAPKNTPFVYKYKINVKNDSLSKQEKTDLISSLENQLDDSINVKTKRKGFYKGINKRVLENPPVYKLEYVDQSLKYMTVLMSSLGYFYDSIRYHTTIDTFKRNELRTTVHFDVVPGKLTRLDSIAYNIDTPYYHPSQIELQRLTDSTRNERTIKRGSPFAKGLVAAEFDRLVQLYRNAGYYRIIREDLVGLWDTLGAEALVVSFDPLEQLQQLQRLKAKRQNPSSDLEIRFLPIKDSSRFMKYYVGKVNIYPTYGFADNGKDTTVKEIARNMFVLQQDRKFKPKIFASSVFMHTGTLYSQRRVQRTINRLNNMGAWEVINIQAESRPGQDTVDFNVYLTPKPKFTVSANLEGGQNNSFLSGNLLGIGGEINLQNRNLGKTANQSNLKLRYGIETSLRGRFIQNRQSGISYNVSFPRFIGPGFIRRSIAKKQLETQWRSILSFNASNTERRDLYNLTVVNASFGWEFQRSRPNTFITNLFAVRYNIEYANLIERQGLKDLILANPSLKNVFTDGLVESVIATRSWTRTLPNKPKSHLSLNAEIAGLLGTFASGRFMDTNLYRFAKISGEYTKHYKLGHSSAFVFRGFLGLGYEFNSTANPDKRAALPFFRQYFAGGPNSMRAWRIRRIGPGSHVQIIDNLERYGDIQLELNAEYRFKIFSISSSMKLEGALFADVGNIWLMKKEAGTANEIFKAERLLQDMGVGLGTGLRFDASLFLIRVDYAYRARNPTPMDAAAVNKWFYEWNILDGQIQIGIGYPFKF